MRLKIDLNGIILKLKIKGYRPSVRDGWDCQWCNVDFSFSSDNWLNYYREDYEVLLACEVENLTQSIDKLLCDELSEQTEISCIEPDFKFILYPKKDLRKDPKYTYIRKGFEFEDVHMEWRVSFWDDGLTDNYLSASLNRETMNILLVYLKYVTGEFKINDPEVVELMQRDFLIE